jgi:hypothetical protein
VRVGRYADAAARNESALVAEDALDAAQKAQGFAVSKDWRGHNTHFLWYAALMQGRGDAPLASARTMAERAKKGTEWSELLCAQCLHRKTAGVATTDRLAGRGADCRQRQQIAEQRQPRMSAVWACILGVSNAAARSQTSPSLTDPLLSFAPSSCTSAAQQRLLTVRSEPRTHGLWHIAVGQSRGATRVR